MEGIPSFVNDLLISPRKPDIQYEPFPYFCVDDYLPRGLYTQLYQDFPSATFFGGGTTKRGKMALNQWLTTTMRFSTILGLTEESLKRPSGASRSNLGRRPEPLRSASIGWRLLRCNSAGSGPATSWSLVRPAEERPSTSVSSFQRRRSSRLNSRKAIPSTGRFIQEVIPVIQTACSGRTWWRCG